MRELIIETAGVRVCTVETLGRFEKEREEDLTGVAVSVTFDVFVSV